MAWKKANETEWSPSIPIRDSFGYSAGNPVLFQEPGGVVWLLFVLLKGNYWNDAELQGSYSPDGGRSWSAPIPLWKEHGMMVRHRPLARSDGSLLLPAYEETSRETVLLESRNSGFAWEEACRFKGHALLQPALVRNGPNRLSLFFRPWTDPRRIWRSHSSNEGITLFELRIDIPTCQHVSVGQLKQGWCVAIRSES
jgi:predicted neuraminidase